MVLRSRFERTIAPVAAILGPRAEGPITGGLERPIAGSLRSERPVPPIVGAWFERTIPTILGSRAEGP
ncbi:MAG: hypothetical protein M3541_17995, partial [Acidobacteriota bacterium]|nr:hypothetical protein [Acidobacteriota bacterium]